MTREWDGARYDRVADPQTRWGLEVLDRLELQGTESVLDVGCGSGRVTEELVSRLPTGRVVALDASASMLDQARARLASSGDLVRFVHLDVLELDHVMLQTDVPLDAVFSTATFHWVTDHQRLFDLLGRLLRPRGQLVSQCGAAGNIANVVTAARSLGVERVGTWEYASVDDTVRRLGRAGFVDVEVWYHPERTPFDREAPLVDFLETVCLREHLATLPAARRRDFAEQVASALPEPAIDYVRLNIVARRAG
jgi:trans-aconitate 2-methyltransferase